MDKQSVVRRREVNEAASCAGPSLSLLAALRSLRRPNVPLRNPAYRIQISNRKPPLLRSSLNHWEQTIAPRSNREFLRVAAILFPRRSALFLLCASLSRQIFARDAVSGFATKIRVKPRDIARHTLPSKFHRNLLTTKNRDHRKVSHFSQVRAPSVVRQDEGRTRLRDQSRAETAFSGVYTEVAADSYLFGCRAGRGLPRAVRRDYYGRVGRAIDEGEVR